jgi:hypothetical protein
MKTINHWKCWTIVIAAVVGAGYGCFAALRNPVAGVSLPGIAITMAISTALFACTASALCRVLQVWHQIRASNRSMDRHDPPQDSTFREPPLRLTRDILTHQRTGGCAL